MVGEGKSAQDCAAWKCSREILQRQFVRMQYRNLKGFREHGGKMIESLREDGGVVDLQPFSTA